MQSRADVKNRPVQHLRFVAWLFIVLSFPCLPAQAYSVLTHEQLVDLAWNDSIRPLLLSRYPNASAAQLQQAHAYAYGGSAIQDMGYYPFGKAFFSDLTHYVRTGDFVVNLFRNQRNINELAFAVGALSHYLGDNIGHSQCINRATPIEFPNLERKYGHWVTYDENEHAHVRTEFAFDIDQMTHHRLAPAAYLRYIGFRVPRRLVERAFYETYGLRLAEVLGPERPAIQSYDSSVRNFIPRFAHAEVVLHGSHFPPDVSDEAFRRYEEQVAKADFQAHWAAAHHHPGFETHLLAIVIFLLPRIGPLSDLAIRGPVSQTEEWYVQSVNNTMSALREVLATLRNPGQELALANRDLDTGGLEKPGTYRLTDQTYANLLHHITADPARHVPYGLKRDFVAYYRDPDVLTDFKSPKDRARLQAELETLRGMKTSNQPETPAPSASNH